MVTCAKADNLSETLESEASLSREETVSEINILQEKIADILQSRTAGLIADF